MKDIQITEKIWIEAMKKSQSTGNIKNIMEKLYKNELVEVFNISESLIFSNNYEKDFGYTAISNESRISALQKYLLQIYSKYSLTWQYRNQESYLEL